MKKPEHNVFPFLMMLSFFILAATVIFFFTDGRASSSDYSEEYVPSTMKRVHDPVQVPGKLLSELHGTKFKNLRLFAFKDSAMVPVVYQFDERTPDGSFIMDMGEGKNPKAHNSTLDGRDFLVFRICDSGGRAPHSAWKNEDGIEIELIDPVDRGKSYVYLFRFPGKAPARLKKDTVSLEHWDPWKNPSWPFIVEGLSYRIKGLVNRINGKYYKTAINKEFRVPKSAGGTNVNILDGQRMRAFCEFKFGIYRVEADETNMIGGIDSLRHGPVRGYGRQWMTKALPLGIKGPRIYSDVFTYDRLIVSPMQLNIPVNPDMIINKAGIEFGYDFNKKAYGMRFYSPNCMDGVTIDGRMNEREKNLPDTYVPWFLVTGPQGSLIFRVSIDPKLLEQTENKLTYIDDLDRAFPPEDVPGSIGYARTTIEMTSVKPGRYKFQIEWYFPPDFYKPGGYDKEMLDEFLNIKDKPIIIKVDGKKAENRALNPPPLSVK
ncbi:MAG: hypothetical protein R6V10_15430 [bacterium]